MKSQLVLKYEADVMKPVDAVTGFISEMIKYHPEIQADILSKIKEHIDQAIEQVQSLEEAQSEE